MNYIKGDVFQGKWDAVVQVCNNYKCFGSGIAAVIANRWPEVYDADKATDDGDEKLGTFSFADVEGMGRFYNLYAMFGLGNDGSALGRNCSYDHLYNSLIRVVTDLCNKHMDAIIEMDYQPRVGVPYLMGCDRAGGSWTIVEAILTDIENNYPVWFDVYQLESAIPKHHRSQSIIPPEILKQLDAKIDLESLDEHVDLDFDEFQLIDNDETDHI